MNGHYPFVNTPLPYDYTALEPYIDEATMHFHHDKHLQTYVDNLNNLLKGLPDYQDWTLMQILYNIASFPEAVQTGVRNNAGGVFNHQFYFANLRKASEGDEGEPTGELRQAIEQAFGSYQAFREKWKAAGLSVFGSGYAWLVVNALGQLAIVTTPNQDTPLVQGLCPVLNLDVWEHAYYLKNQNRRAEYIDNWFHVINWEQAEKNYLECLGR